MLLTLYVFSIFFSQFQHFVDIFFPNLARVLFPKCLDKALHNWHNYNKKLKFSDSKNTRKIYAFFSRQKSSETSKLEVDEQNENRPSSSDTVISPGPFLYP